MPESIKPYFKEAEVSWADTDPNAHLRHSAYSDFATHARVSFFAENGFTRQKLAKFHLGPILLKEETVFLREVLLSERVKTSVELMRCTKDYSHYTIQHNVMNTSKKTAARVTVSGTWVHLITRKLILPPADLIEKALDRMPRTADFHIAPRSDFIFI
jgi:acyl-CoA thioester hydrolase